jgi:hypothetical protein
MKARICPVCASRLAPNEPPLHVTDAMLRKAVRAYERAGPIQQSSDHDEALREALAAALEVRP